MDKYVYPEKSVEFDDNKTGTYVPTREEAITIINQWLSVQKPTKTAFNPINKHTVESWSNHYISRDLLNEVIDSHPDFRRDRNDFVNISKRAVYPSRDILTQELDIRKVKQQTDGHHSCIFYNDIPYR